MQPHSAESIISSFGFSIPKEINTKRGPKLISKARDTYENRAAWQAHKDVLRAAGVSFGAYNGRWEFSLWQDVPKAAIEQRQAAIAQSRAADADVEIPAPDGLTYLPYQKAGVAYSLAHPSVLFGDEMGLGKTIQAIGTINADASLQKILVLCPASLRLNWARELAKWLVVPRTIAIADTKTMPDTQIVIANYDIASKLSEKLRAVNWDALIADEAHFLKNGKAARTKAVLGDFGKNAIQARRKIFLTGTPIPNRPVEGWTIFSALAPAAFPNFWAYAKRYCGAFNNGFGWEMGGASNLGELQDKLRSSCMIRRLKKDVLEELPPKTRQIIELSRNGSGKAVEAEIATAERGEAQMEQLRVAVELAKADSAHAYENAVSRLKEAARAVFTELAKARHDTAVAKAPKVAEIVMETLEADEQKKVVVFAHHHDVIDILSSELAAFGVVVLTGDTPMEARQSAVDKFQTDPKTRVFIGSITAAGVGLTLTAAAHVIFAELDWVPGNVTQAEDRCHRIGQRENVLIQHIVIDGSIDALLAKTIVSKQDVIDRALDREKKEISEVTAVPSRHACATESLSRARIEEEAPALISEQIVAIHSGLQILSGMCDGAASIDGSGFSKIDVMIGHSLARQGGLSPKQAVIGKKLCNKYRRQLPDELLKAALGK